MKSINGGERNRCYSLYARTSSGLPALGIFDDYEKSSAVLILLFLTLLFLISPGLAQSSGDLATIHLDLPPQSVSDVKIVYDIPAGVIYDASTPFSIEGAKDTAIQTITGPNDGSLPTTITWDFGTFDNSLNKDLDIYFKIILADVDSNQAGVLRPPARVVLSFKSWSDGSEISYTSADHGNSVMIVEPDLRIERSFDPSDGSVGDEVYCYFSIYHSVSSTSNAFDVSLTDSLPDGMSYVGPTEVISGPDCNLGEKSWNLPEIDQSWNNDNKIQLRYKAKIDSAIHSPNHATLNWYSAPSGGSQSRHYSEISESRTYGSCSSPPRIESLTVSPQNGEVAPGGTATLKVVASGSGLTYQWFKAVWQSEGGFLIYGATLLKDGGHISGAKTDTLTISNYDCSDNGTYSVIVSNLCGFDSRWDYLNEKYSLAYQPGSQEVLEGETASFSIAVDPPGVYSYQWQKLGDGYVWNDIQGATTSRLSLTTTLEDSGCYRAVVTSGGCTWTTGYYNSVYLGVITPNGPDDQSVLGWGEPVQFTVGPSDDINWGYKWQYSDDGGTTWNSINGETWWYYSFATSAADASRKYRVIITDKATGFSKPSREAVIHNSIVGPEDQTVGFCQGQEGYVGFEVKPSSSIYEYTWYRSGSGGWELLSGQNSWYCQYLASISDNNRKFYVHIKNQTSGAEGDSRQAILSVYSSPCISDQPYGQTVCPSDTATFHVSATGDSLTYQWFKTQSPGAEIKLVDDGRISGSTTNNLRISNVESSDAAYYYVVVKGLYNSETQSGWVGLTVGLPSIIGPSDESVCSGSYVNFFVEPQDYGTYNYQWQSSSDGGNTWQDIYGENYPSYGFVTSSSDTGKKYHVIVSGNSVGCSKSSRDATLTLTSHPDLKITLEGSPNPVHPGEYLKYTLGYLNKGCDATNVAIDAIYDSNVQFVSADPAPDVGNNHWTLTDLYNDQPGSIQITVQVPYSSSSGTVISSATLSADGGATASASASTQIQSGATVLYINKEASMQAITYGQELEYAINYQNLGASNLHNVTVNDTIDKNLEFLASTPPPTIIRRDNDGTHLWWSAADLGSQSMPLPLEFGENTPESLIVSDFTGGRLANGGTSMQNKLDMAWEEDGGSPGAFVSVPDGSDWVVVQDFDPGEFAGNLDFQQVVAYADPVGSYSGSMTVFVGNVV